MKTIELIARAKQVKEGLETIRHRVTGVVMFIDLVGSTDFKATNPDEDVWLVRLATFLTSVTRIIEPRGRVVKYIGDEVMAFFEGSSSAVLNAEHVAEEVLQFCDQFKEQAFEVKIGIDYGSVSMLDFVDDKKAKFGRDDPNGVTVDRCARLMSKTAPGVVLCSADFVTASKHKQRWVAAGRFRAKGIRGLVRIFQLRDAGAPLIKVSDDDLNLEDCLKQLRTTEGYLQEVKALQKPLARRPRS